MGRPLQHPGASKALTPPLVATGKGVSLPSSASTQNLQDVPEIPTIRLALQTLGTFDFEGNICKLIHLC